MNNNNNVISKFFGRKSTVDAAISETQLSASTVPTMSSLEIAELTGKEHRNVMADIRNMLESLGLTTADFSAVVPFASGQGAIRTREIYNLPKDLTITLVSGYSVKMRYAIITRWGELEAIVAAPAPKTTYSIEDFAVALLESKAQNKLLTEELETAQPAVDFVESYVDADGLLNTGQVATKFGMSARALNTLLKELHYKQKTVSGKDVLTIKGVNSGWFASKSWKRNGVTGEQIYITPAGVLRISQLLSK